MKKQRILIIEDNPDISKALSEVLSDCGHSIDLASNGKEALDHLYHSELPDVIILDMFMPIIGGIEFRNRIKTIPSLALIPIIGMSADAFGKRRFSACGIDLFLHKPFELSDLLRMLEDLSRKKGNHDSHESDHKKRNA